MKFRKPTAERVLHFLAYPAGIPLQLFLMLVGAVAGAIIGEDNGEKVIFALFGSFFGFAAIAYLALAIIFGIPILILLALFGSW